MSELLKDPYGRSHNYLRISLLERCNLRCTYCMPEEGVPLRPKKEFMTQEELFELIDSFIELGINKIRLTGGEPLLKKNFHEIFNYVKSKGVEIAITTNGILLDKYWKTIQTAELTSLNISLDTLNKERFATITRRDYFDRVLSNIQEAIRIKLPVKLNVVLMRNFNEDEIINFIELTKNSPIIVRFIEFMPFDGNNWNWEKKISEKEILHSIQSHYGKLEITELPLELNGTARNYQIKRHLGKFGLISSITNPFCDSCNRIRLTADGKIKNCLFSQTETDLLHALRNGMNPKPLIIESIKQKHKERGGLPSFDNADFESNNRSMITIGG